MLVVAIIALLLGIVGPTLGGRISGTRLESCARQMARFVDLVRSEAVVQGRFFYLVYGVEKGRYWYERPEPGEDPDAPRLRIEKILPAEVKIREVILGESESVYLSDASIEVNPLGTMGTHRVVLESGGRALVVRVPPFGGRTVVEAWSEP